jgi:hypothetical protein
MSILCQTPNISQISICFAMGSRKEKKKEREMEVK